MSDPRLQVTEAELWCAESIAGTAELAALDRWSERFGFRASRCPIDLPIVRDVERRRIYYGVIDPEAPNFIREAYVQLESPPPPWPREVYP